MDGKYCRGREDGDQTLTIDMKLSKNQQFASPISKRKNNNKDSNHNNNTHFLPYGVTYKSALP